MNITRRGLLRLGAVTGASIALPRLVRGWRDYRGAASGALTAPSAVHTYEEGSDASGVPLGDGVVAKLGNPVYSAADAMHEDMGWVSAGKNRGGRLIYDNPATAGSSGSVYLLPQAIPPGSSAVVVALTDGVARGSTLARVRLRSDGRIDVVDAGNARIAISQATFGPAERLRLDWQQRWDGSTLEMTVWLYLAANAEGWRPDDILTGSFTSAIPTNVSLGEAFNKLATVGFDTYREYGDAGFPTPYRPGTGASALHPYDEGTDGAPLRVGTEGVTGVWGSPTYSPGAALHGPLGLLADGGATVRYDNPYPPAHTGSLYLRTAAAGGGDSRIVTIQNGSNALAQLKVSARGLLSLADPAGAILAQTTSRIRTGRWVRVDWQVTWDGESLFVTARYFATNPESADNYTEISATLPAAQVPDTLEVGSRSVKWVLHFDTFRTVGDVTEWPAPFNPTPVRRAPGMAGWSGDATQTTAEVSAYTNDTTSVGVGLSLAADMSQAFFLPSAPPNAAGWNKWSVTGLAPGTQYYYQFTDTHLGGNPQPIGDISRFKTLQPANVACTIRIAVGSCEQTNPAQTPAFDDIVAWGPDRTVHLGDFGYPSDLSKDLATHMNNWSLNCTDTGIHRIQAQGCMDYVVSDHDGNGTGATNRPNYDDEITMANIAAWQQVVPARMDDTRSPPRGRWRSDVEGNVRFVKLDTRSVDRTDNTATPTDPRSPDSTMLGATQLGWLKAQIDAAVLARQLLVVFSDCAWNGTSPGPPIPASYADKWPSYIYERDLISDYAASSGAQMFIVFGDSHGLQQDDGGSERNGFATACCGPFDQELHMHYQDSYQWSYPVGIPEHDGPYRHAQQYQRLTIAQEAGSASITVTVEARDCSPAVPGTPLTVRTMTNTYEL